jgi:nitroreductase
MMNLDTFELLVKARRATRHFKSDPIPDGLLERLLEIAHWAPSGYNLQPTHFVVVTQPELKQELRRACMNQVQVTEAPATVVFTGDRRVLENHFEKVLQQELAAGSISAQYEQVLRKYVPLAFEQGPLGMSWLWKAVAPPFRRFSKPTPSLPAVQKRFWLSKQVMLSSMVFMLAATAAGLATAPMEGFDEVHVRRCLNIPRSHLVPLVIPVGYAVEGALVSTRLPVQELIHWNGW